jgi:hypothetical protein
MSATLSAGIPPQSFAPDDVPQYTNTARSIERVPNTRLFLIMMHSPF